MPGRFPPLRRQHCRAVLDSRTSPQQRLTPLTRLGPAYRRSVAETLAFARGTARYTAVPLTALYTYANVEKALGNPVRTGRAHHYSAATGALPPKELRMTKPPENAWTELTDQRRAAIDP
jgi:hypothetical protein